MVLLILKQLRNYYNKMLFNSYEFILFFLPTVLVLFYVVGKVANAKSSILVLVLSSLFFYGWWNPLYLPLLFSSILVNFFIGKKLGKSVELKTNGRNPKTFLIIGVVFNLFLLGYFKYANFFVENYEILSKSQLGWEVVILPIAISFFTFQQIAYLIDSYRDETHEYSFLNYCLFITFFPQLIAGPIVHHKEMLPQFSNKNIYRLSSKNIAIGLTIFTIGLFKKVVIADSIANYATPVFEAADNGIILTFLEAWAGALSYSFQLYFDFSGYSDMAIGLGFMFGIRLPINFNSPYKATNIIDFWSRWHMTLSKFLREYLYFILGGNRKGLIRRYSNILLTMLIGGIWHGAGWGFLFWGLLHGIYICINHAWRYLNLKTGLYFNGILYRYISLTLTFLAVTIAWIPFRATTLDGTFHFFSGMAGLNGLVIPEAYAHYFSGLASYVQFLGITFGSTPGFRGFFQVWLLFLLLLIVWFLPNSNQYMSIKTSESVNLSGNKKSKYKYFLWSMNVINAGIIGFMLAIALMSINELSEFLYFQF
ncbi:MBOAT family protein [Oceanospirillaceae bacterium]|nr:MBOAT family protein [Oceanospirillaceae bacterium]